MKKSRILFVSIGVIVLGFIIILSIPYRLINQESVKIYDNKGKLLYDVRDEYRQANYKTINDVPDFLEEFLVKKEDKRFWKHYGVDFHAIIRAIQFRIVDGQTQGASTIDQQVIKLSQQAFTRTFFQKIKENLLAWNINIHYSKEAILLYYINNLYFPNGVKGYQTACQVYFGQTCADLSHGHLLYLYAMTKYPNKKSLSDYSFRISQRYGLDNYTIKDFDTIASEKGFFIKNTARHYVNYILQNNNTPDTNILHTDFDTSLYENIQNNIELLDAYFETKDAANICVIVLKEGKLVSMNVFPKFGQEYINGCLQPRQVGSAIKPFLYTLAFKQLGYNKNTKIDDTAISFNSDYGNYSPQNFDMNYHGKVTLAQALGNSFNIPAVKLLDKIGNKNFYYFLSDIGHLVGTHELWMDDIQHYGLALGLGVKEISPLDFTKMRSIFQKCENFTIETTTKTSINSVGYHKNELKEFCKQYKHELKEVKEILSHNANRLISFGQYNWFNNIGSYGKSGTSRHFIDGWICGGIGPYTACAWAGNYSNKPMLGGGHEVVGPLRFEIIRSLKKNY